MAKFSEEQLQHFLAHPDEIDATDKDLVNALAAMDGEITALAEGEEDGDTKRKPAPKASDPDDDDAKAAKEEAEAKIAAEGKEGTEGESARVATKDGRGTLPFAVLKEARERSHAAEAALAEAYQTINAMSNQLKGGRAHAMAEPSAVERKLGEMRAMLPELEKEAPWQVPVMQKMIDTMDLARQELQNLSGARQRDEAEMINDLRSQAADAKESNPTLVLWEATRPDLFAEAMKADKFLRSDPEMSAQYETFDARFAAAVDIVRARHAGEEVPEPSPVQQRDSKDQPSASDATARAKARLAKAASETAVRTLSDIPAGAGEMSSGEAIERMTSAEAGAMFMRMSPQQILDWTMTH